jgi:hypothetical protein
MRKVVFALVFAVLVLAQAALAVPYVYIQSEASFVAGPPGAKNDFEARQLQIRNEAFMAFRPSES